MTRRAGCRRSHPRYPLDADGWLEFGYPRPEDPPCVLELRDMSQGGLAFVLRQELPGLDVGDSIDQVEVRIGDRVVRGNLLVMHFTPDASAGSVCGALFYPGEDVDLLTLRAILRDLEERRPEGAQVSP